jgi:hypothetical protein
VLGAISAQSDRDAEELQKMHNFCDDRHVLRGGPDDRAGDFWRDPIVLESRRRARRAVNLVRNPARSGERDIRDGGEGGEGGDGDIERIDGDIVARTLNLEEEGEAVVVDANGS